MMFKECICLILALSAKTVAFSDEGHCIWYGECYTSFFGSKTNCPYHGPPIPLNQSAPAWKTLKEMCPDLVKDAETHGLCCDEKMVNTFTSSQAIPRMFLGGCPTCYHNFRHLWCQSACSPRQSQFMEIVTNKTEMDNVTHVTEVNYYITSHYAESLFQSCRSVKKSGMSALDMMCGELDAEDCTAEAWLSYLGNNDFAPFITYFHVVNSNMEGGVPKGIIPVNVTAIGCEQGLEGAPGCTCEHCSNAC